MLKPTPEKPKKEKNKRSGMDIDSLFAPLDLAPHQEKSPEDAGHPPSLSSTTTTTTTTTTTSTGVRPPKSGSNTWYQLSDMDIEDIKPPTLAEILPPGMVLPRPNPAGFEHPKGSPQSLNDLRAKQPPSVKRVHFERRALRREQYGNPYDRPKPRESHFNSIIFNRDLSRFLDSEGGAIRELIGIRNLGNTPLTPGAPGPEQRVRPTPVRQKLPVLPHPEPGSLDEGFDYYGLGEQTSHPVVSPLALALARLPSSSATTTTFSQSEPTSSFLPGVGYYTKEQYEQFNVADLEISVKLMNVEDGNGNLNNPDLKGKKPR